MKMLFFRSILLLVMLFGLFAIGCKKDDPIDCRLDYLGVWDVNEDYTFSANGSAEPTQNDKYQMTISNSATNSSLVLFSNFGNFGQAIEVELRGDCENFTIPSQNLTLTFSGTQYQFNFSGSGKIIGGELLKYTYTANAGAVLINGTCEATKK